jgi:hypothetical protein
MILFLILPITWFLVGCGGGGSTPAPPPPFLINGNKYTTNGEYTIPDGVSTITIVAIGGAGSDGLQGVKGGKGAKITSTSIPISTNGTKIKMVIGKKGINEKRAGGGSTNVRINEQVIIAGGGSGGAVESGNDARNGGVNSAIYDPSYKSWDGSIGLGGTPGGGDGGYGGGGGGGVSGSNGGGVGGGEGGGSEPIGGGGGGFGGGFSISGFGISGASSSGGSIGYDHNNYTYELGNFSEDGSVTISW